MISRRKFLGCSLCTITGSALARERSQRKRLVLCASDANVADAQFHRLQDVDWSSFYIEHIPRLFDGCFQAFGIRQRVAFSDEIPLQASFNEIDFNNPRSSLMHIGLGNLALYPYSTIVAVMLHELGHYYCCRSEHWERIESYSVQKQVELLADFMAGAAYARMEPSSLLVAERVDGQCSVLEVASAEGKFRSRHGRSSPTGKIALNPRRLARADSKAQFFVLRNWQVTPLTSNALIGPMPDEDPTGTRCTTVHARTLDFLAIAGAVSSWRTFGDRPTTESHGTASERYDAFSLGYETAIVDDVRSAALLPSSLLRGMQYLEIGK